MVIKRMANLFVLLFIMTALLFAWSVCVVHTGLLFFEITLGFIIAYSRLFFYSRSRFQCISLSMCKINNWNHRHLLINSVYTEKRVWWLLNDLSKVELMLKLESHEPAGGAVDPHAHPGFIAVIPHCVFPINWTFSAQLVDIIYSNQTV